MITIIKLSIFLGSSAKGAAGGLLDRGQPHLPQGHIQPRQCAEGRGREARQAQLLPEPALALAKAPGECARQHPAPAPACFPQMPPQRVHVYCSLGERECCRFGG